MCFCDDGTALEGALEDGLEDGGGGDEGVGTLLWLMALWDGAMMDPIDPVVDDADEDVEVELI